MSDKYLEDRIARLEEQIKRLREEATMHHQRYVGMKAEYDAVETIFIEDERPYHRDIPLAGNISPVLKELADVRVELDVARKVALDYESAQSSEIRGLQKRVDRAKELIAEALKRKDSHAFPPKLWEDLEAFSDEPMKCYGITELVEIIEDPKANSCRIQIECDDRTGVGLVLELMAIDGIAGVPRDWLQIVCEQTGHEIVGTTCECGENHL